MAKQDVFLFLEGRSPCSESSESDPPSVGVPICALVASLKVNVLFPSGQFSFLFAFDF